MVEKKKVAWAFLGTQLDAGGSPKRWDRWRPTIALAVPQDLALSRLELFITDEGQRELADAVRADINQLNPALTVVVNHLPIEDVWQFPETFNALWDFVAGYRFLDDEEYYAHLVTGTHVEKICLFLLAETRHLPAFLLNSRPRKQSPEDTVEAWRAEFSVIDLELASYDQLASRFKAIKHSSTSILKNGIETLNESFNTLIERVEKIAVRSNAPILLTGPTGAGKTQLAGQIYQLRLQRHLVKGKFIEVNCATLRDTNAMSALFGHKKGAFTGATSDRPGLLRSADQGVLLLDEIGTLGLDEQAMLLRAIEDKKFFPMGSDSPVESNFLLIAGTNSDLQEAVANGSFRQDLLERINLWSFELPGLADRPEDLAPNLEFELARVGTELGVRVSFNAAAKRAYLTFAKSHAWKGNFRELHASVTRMATLCDGGRITEDDVSLELLNLRKQNAHREGGGYPLCARVLRNRAAEHDLFEIAQLEAVLQVVKRSNSMAEAGRALFHASAAKKTSNNDSHRLKFFLSGWGLEFKDVKRLLYSNAD